MVGSVPVSYGMNGNIEGDAANDLSYDSIMTILFPNIEIVDKIGKFHLPFEVVLKYDMEEDIYCVECEALDIVNCGNNYEEAKNGLEQELEDAIKLYVDIYREDELNSQAKKYRQLLSEIKGINSESL